jgi:hypothetical protein
MILFQAILKAYPFIGCKLGHSAEWLVDRLVSSLLLTVITYVRIFNIISLKGQVSAHRSSLTQPLIVHVPRQNIERSCVCVLVVHILPLSTALDLWAETCPFSEIMLKMRTYVITVVLTLKLWNNNDKKTCIGRPYTKHGNIYYLWYRYNIVISLKQDDPPIILLNVLAYIL